MTDATTDKGQSQEWQQFSTMTEEMLMQSQKAFAQLIECQPSGNVGMGSVKQVQQIVQDTMLAWMNNPIGFVESQVQLWNNYMTLWQRTVFGFMEGKPVLPMITPNKGDRRFKHEDWENMPLFDFIKQAYLLTAEHITETINNLEHLDDKRSQQAAFYTRQFVAALSPSNFAATNPEVLRMIVESKGENLIKGMQNLIDDFKRGKGVLNIRMTDLEAFAVGKNIAMTAGQVVYENETMQLIQYTPTTKNVYEKPVLIIPPWINKYYILDLQEKNSFVKYLLDQGLTVFLVSWVNPDGSQQTEGFADYMQEGIFSALCAIEQAIGIKEVNAIGYCIGGTLLAASLAYMAKKNDDRIASATFFTTLLDFTEPGEIGVFIDEEQVTELEQLMNEKGYLSGRNMALTFNMLRENDLIWSYFVNNYLCGKEPFPFDLLYWNSDSTNLPEKLHSYYLRNMYLNNTLIVPGGLEFNDVPIDLAAVNVPSYFLSAEQDHIAPWKSTYAGAQLLGGEVKFVLGGSGHIAGVVNPPLKNKYGYWSNDELPDSSEAWLETAAQNEGSWWPHWVNWVAKYSGKKVPARDPSTGGLTVIEPAPGRYVKVQVDDMFESYVTDVA
ncbi:class I poly(R)-hydroxyalkanoic acid synthase [Piscirickettsia salmonis]|uniref:class I poly(R)-hydroxyalkanoic acid synthase n=1 Tax=Piscirickettsia salmonis TaxID=1238 RepID=UPI000F08CA21|nr:class I poly(R)-hydroxyalkanoic acid synthase [Piscirickettsiaceae bacterium NZ-RLO2]